MDHCSSPLLVATREYGLPAQPWMRRQLTGLASMNPRILCWTDHPLDSGPVAPDAIHPIAFDPAPFDGSRRWSFRMANLRRGNFYALRGAEMQHIELLLKSVKPSAILCYDGNIVLKLVDTATKLGIPFVAYFHGDLGLTQNRWYWWSLARRLDQFTAVVVVNEVERRMLGNRGFPDNKLHVIPCGAPTDVFQPQPRKDHEGVRFVMTSRLDDQKGCIQSAHAFGIVASRRPDTSLHVYGDGPELAAMQAIFTSQGVADRVVFHGFVAEHVMANELPQGDVFIQHSLRSEGSPVSIVEAMASGLPVVSTAVGGILDQVVENETGFLVAQRDVTAMAVAMTKLVDDDALRSRMGANARLRAVELFDSKPLAERLRRVVQDVVETSVRDRTAHQRP